MFSFSQWPSNLRCISANGKLSGNHIVQAVQCTWLSVNHCQVPTLNGMSISIGFGAIRSCNVSRSPKSPKKSTKPSILTFEVIELGANRKPVYDFLLVINSNLSCTILRYSDLLAKNRKFCPPPSHLAPSFGMTPFEFIEKLYGSWN